MPPQQIAHLQKIKLEMVSQNTLADQSFLPVVSGGLSGGKRECRS
jgi:hypothetical protein